MSNREIQDTSSVQKWRGVDQRTQPTLVQDGFFSMSRGVFFGLGDNAERLPGKTVAANLGLPIFQVFVIGSIALVQTTTDLYTVPLSDLLAGQVTFHDCIYSSDGDANGAFYFLGTDQGQAGWVNPQTGGFITVTASGILAGQGGLEVIVDRQASHFHTTNSAPAWIKADLQGCKLRLNTWSYRYRDNSTADSPVGLLLEASNDNSTWVTVDSRTGLTVVISGWLTFVVAGQTNYYRYFRLSVIQPNSSGNAYLTIGEFEIYGRLKLI